MLCGCRAFAFGRRRDGFDLLPIQARGFTSAGHQQVQLELVWRSRCRHELSDLLPLSFNPSSGTGRAFAPKLSDMSDTQDAAAHAAAPAEPARSVLDRASTVLG